jgi:hypothetical protein
MEAALRGGFFLARSGEGRPTGLIQRLLEVGASAPEAARRNIATAPPIATTMTADILAFARSAESAQRYWELIGCAAFCKSGDRIREIHREAEMTQQELGKKCDLHRTFIGCIERGESSISRRIG